MSSKSEVYEVRVARLWLRVAGWLLPVCYLMITAALYGTFLYAPTEKVMGEVQRIFYFHVGAAFNAFLAFFFVFLSGIIYLITRRALWDQIAATSVEVGVVFTTIVLATGPVWAKPAWNTWFPWGDPRVMTTLVLWLIYLAYLILRSSIPDGEKRYKFCAVFGIIGFIDVPIVHMSIRWWRTIHPVVLTKTGANLEPEMVQVLVLATLACFLLMMTLILVRGAGRLNQHLAERLVVESLDREGR